MYEWWYGKSSTLATRNACTTSHVHVHLLACHILTSKKNYFSWDTFRCIYFSAWLLFSSTFNLQKVETVAREPRLDSFPKVHGFSMPIETLLKTHAHARLRHLLFYVFKKTGNSRKKMCWIPRKDLMTYHPRCVEFQEKISWRTIPDVLNSKKRSHDITSQMCSSPKNVITPPHPPHPPPPQPTPRQKKTTKKTKKEVSLRRNTKKKENMRSRCGASAVN